LGQDQGVIGNEVVLADADVGEGEQFKASSIHAEELFDVFVGIFSTFMRPISMFEPQLREDKLIDDTFQLL
jgi:hypothetical protein